MYKLILNELKQSGNINFEICDIERDFKGFPDIKKINKAIVSGSYKFLSNSLNVNLDVNANLTMLCSYTLEDVIVSLDTNFDFIFSSDDDSDYPLTDTIDLEEIIIGNIIAEAPYNVYKK